MARKSDIERDHPLIRHQAERIRMAAASAKLSARELAAKVTAELGYPVSRNRMGEILDGVKGATPLELSAIASVTGQSVEMVRGDEYVLRGLDGAKGLYPNSDGHNKWQDWQLILQSDHLARDLDSYGFDHEGRLVHKSWLHTDTPPEPAIDLQVERLPLDLAS